MHDEVTRNHLSGTILDSDNVVEHRERLVQFIESRMRDDGHVPLLDMEPQYTQRWNGAEFEFDISVYSVFVGHDRAAVVAGVMGGKEIMNYNHIGQR